MNGPSPLTDITQTDPEDCRLVARARSGEGEALEELVRRHQPWIYNVAVRMLYYAVGGVLVASVVTAFLPSAPGQMALLALAAVFGAVSGTAGVATGVALAGAAPPASRGVVMGGYSTALYLGLALGSFALGPVITRHGYSAGFSVGGLAGVVGALIAALLWARGACGRRRSTVTSSVGRCS